MTVLFLPEVEEYIYELIDILYKKNYFGFRESASMYVNDLVQDISFNLPSKVKKIAPSYFDRYGSNMYYASFRKNRNTMWYVFFNIYKYDNDTIFFVRYLSNNHVIAQYLLN
jgi:hypothetical protein